MRKLLVLMACAVAISAASAAAHAAETSDAKDSPASEAAKDPNYRWHNGQWWYWMPKQKSWLVWDGSQWQPYEPAQADRGAVRSFSYDEQANPGDAAYGQAVQRVFGTPLSTVPNSVSGNNQIIGSFGFRGAGSKMIGKY